MADGELYVFKENLRGRYPTALASPSNNPPFSIANEGALMWQK